MAKDTFLKGLAGAVGGFMDATNAQQKAKMDFINETEKAYKLKKLEEQWANEFLPQK